MPITAGIATTIFCDAMGDIDSLSDSVSTALTTKYADRSFIRILGEGNFADTKHVVRTNFVDIGWVVDKRTGRLILSSAEDNLGKGAASQSIQSLNLINGLPETCGLLNF